MIVVLAKSAQKDYNHLPQTEQKKVNKKLTLLESNPYEGKKLTGDFIGFYSLRAWPYRIIYRINIVENQIYILNIEHRQGVYN